MDFCLKNLNQTERNLLDNISSFLFSNYDTNNRQNEYIYNENIDVCDYKVHLLQPSM